MTTREEMQARVIDAVERYERERMKPRRRMAWSRMKQDGVRLPMQKPKTTKALRVWCADDCTRS